MDKNKSIEILNIARSMELRAIQQYMIQHYYLTMESKDDELAKFMKLIAIDEMRHAEKLAERIRELGGIPTLKLVDEEIKLNQKVHEIYKFDNELETNTIKTYKKFITDSINNEDEKTSELFKTITKEEEIHQQYYEDTENKISKKN